MFFHIIHTIFHRRLLNFPAYSVYFEFGRNFFPIFINSLWKTEEAAKKGKYTCHTSSNRAASAFNESGAMSPLIYSK